MLRQVIISLIAFSMALVAYAENQPPTTWYGIHNMDSLFTGCKITTVNPLYSSSYFGNSTPKSIDETLHEKRLSFENFAKENGYHAILGFRSNFHGGAGGGKIKYGYTTENYVLISGVLTVSGTAVKLNCEKT